MLLLRQRCNSALLYNPFHDVLNGIADRVLNGVLYLLVIQARSCFSTDQFFHHHFHYGRYGW